MKEKKALSWGDGLLGERFKIKRTFSYNNIIAQTQTI